jgi:hypothetical protein
MYLKIKRLIGYLLSPGWFKLKSYETDCINQWRSALSPEAALILDQQLKRLNYFRRYLKGKLLVFYCFNNVEFQHWPKELSFPIGGEERCVFRLKLKPTSSDKGKNIRVEIVLYQGRLSTLQFNPSPFVCKAGYEIIESMVLLDPMMQNLETQSKTISRIDLPDCLKDMVQNSDVVVKSAFPLDYRSKLLGQIDATLPTDYFKFIEQYESLDTFDFVIHGLSSIRHVPQLDNYYIVLADIKTKGSIGVLQGSKNCNLYYIDNEMDEIENVGVSLLDAIRRKVKDMQDE